MDNYIEKALKTINKKIPADCEADYQQVKKNNGVILDGFIIREQGNSIAPTFYLSQEDRENMTPEEFAERIAKRFEIERERGIDFDVANFTDVDWVKKHIMFEIVNRGRNEGSNLASIPITPDLMIAFKVAVMPNASIRITNEHVHNWGDISLEELLENARQNAVVMDKVSFRSISDVLIDMMLNEYKAQYPNVPENEFRNRIKEEMFGGVDGMLYVLSTQRQSNAALLYPDVLSEIREKLDDDLVILPSSIHEILVMKKADALEIGLDACKSMVREVNRDVVMQDDATDFLSDELLYYDGTLRQIDEHEFDKDSMAI